MMLKPRVAKATYSKSGVEALQTIFLNFSSIITPYILFILSLTLRLPHFVLGVHVQIVRRFGKHDTSTAPNMAPAITSYRSNIFTTNKPRKLEQSYNVFDVLPFMGFCIPIDSSIV